MDFGTVESYGFPKARLPLWATGDDVRQQILDIPFEDLPEEVQQQVLSYVVKPPQSLEATEYTRDGPDGARSFTAYDGMRNPTATSRAERLVDYLQGTTTPEMFSDVGRSLLEAVTGAADLAGRSVSDPEGLSSVELAELAGMVPAAGLATSGGKLPSYDPDTVNMLLTDRSSAWDRLTAWQAARALRKGATEQEVFDMTAEPGKGLSGYFVDPDGNLIREAYDGGVKIRDDVKQHLETGRAYGVGGLVEGKYTDVLDFDDYDAIKEYYGGRRGLPIRNTDLRMYAETPASALGTSGQYLPQQNMIDTYGHLSRLDFDDMLRTWAHENMHAIDNATYKGGSNMALRGVGSNPASDVLDASGVTDQFAGVRSTLNSITGSATTSPARRANAEHLIKELDKFQSFLDTDKGKRFQYFSDTGEIKARKAEERLNYSVEEIMNDRLYDDPEWGLGWLSAAVPSHNKGALAGLLKSRDLPARHRADAPSSHALDGFNSILEETPKAPVQAVMKYLLSLEGGN